MHDSGATLREHVEHRRGKVASRVVLAAIAVGIFCAVATAQSISQEASEAPEDAPVQCWLKTAKTAVHIGEHFNVALTCSVLDTPRLAAVPDLAQIEPATIQFPPFEVMGGVRHPDVHSGSRRYFQFEYTLRLIADGFFGRDLPIPPVTLKYNLSMATGGSTQQGRERAYVLPAIPVRVMSLVPQLAGDIRDASRNTFADIEKLRFRSQVAFVVAVVLFSFAAVFLLLAATSGFAVYRGGASNAPRRLSDGALLAACARVLNRVRKAAVAEGWKPELVTEGLAALRIGAAIGAGLPVSQIVTSLDATPSEGQIAARIGLLRPRRVLMSAAVTSLSISAQLETGEPGFAPRLRPSIETLRDALVVFSAMRYAGAVTPHVTAIGHAADSAASAVQALRIAKLAPVRLLDAAFRSSKRWSLVWTR